jgi:hypothetical protein
VKPFCWSCDGPCERSCHTGSRHGEAEDIKCQRDKQSQPLERSCPNSNRPSPVAWMTIGSRSHSRTDSAEGHCSKAVIRMRRLVWSVLSVVESEHGRCDDFEYEIVALARPSFNAGHSKGANGADSVLKTCRQTSREVGLRWSQGFLQSSPQFPASSGVRAAPGSKCQVEK